LQRKVPRERLERPQRRKLALQPRRDNLEDPHRPGQVTQPMLTEIDQQPPVGETFAHQQFAGTRHQQLAAMTDCHQPSAAVQRLVQILAVDHYPFAGMDRHAGPQDAG